MTPPQSILDEDSESDEEKPIVIQKRMMNTNP